MRGALTSFATVLVLAMLASCAPSEGDSTDVPRREDGRAEADGTGEAEAEADAAGCTSSAQCDDGIACTQDTCQAGGSCVHHALDALCADGQRCAETEGCVDAACTNDDQCADGVYCNGDEICSGTCYPNPAGRTCDDGNSCTDDRCDTGLDRCVYEPNGGEGCATDGGDASTPFDPLVHYSGDFWLAPPQSQACPGVTYSIDTISFSRSDSELVVYGPPCAMRQAPPPVDENFSVTCTQGCGTYTLTGTFSDSADFSGHWTATFPGCPACSTQNVGVVGARI